MTETLRAVSPNEGSESAQLGVYAGYAVPPGTTGIAREQAVQPPQPTTTDELQRDADTPGALPEWPEGAPALRPLHQLPFDQRADAMEAFAEIQGMQAQLPKAGTEVGLTQAAVMYRVYAKLDRFLVTVAEDRAYYEAWDGRWDDVRFGKLWAAYQARMSPGEASGSSS